MPETRQVVAFSGGVDSTALALLSPDAIVVFTDTGWEFPETYAHVARFEQITGREVVRLRNASYPGGIPEYAREHKFLPGIGVRWCTTEFKIKPMNAYLRNLRNAGPVELLIGLRADEPMRTGNLTELDGVLIRYPLRERGMTRIDCVRVCLEHNLLPRYPVYMARGGCIGCFYKRRSEVQAMVSLVPHIVDELQALEEEVQDQRHRYYHLFPNIGCSLRDFRAQQTLFDLNEVYAEASRRDEMGIACGLFCNR